MRDGIRLAAAHVELVIAHAQRQDSLVDADTRSEEDKIGRLLVDGLDDKLAIVERNVPDLGPREADLRCEAVILFVDIQSKGIHAEPQLGALLVADLEVVHAVHFQILCDLEVLHHGVLAEHSAVLLPPGGDRVLPLVLGHLMLIDDTLWQ